jgi:hypothetical protein
LVWRSTQTPPQIPIQEKGSRAACVQLMTRFAGASNQSLSADVTSLRSHDEFKEKRSKIKYKKNGRENLNYNNDTWRPAGKWGTCQLTSTHHTIRALTITKQQRCGFFFFFFFF